MTLLIHWHFTSSNSSEDFGYELGRCWVPSTPVESVWSCAHIHIGGDRSGTWKGSYEDKYPPTPATYFRVLEDLKGLQCPTTTARSYNYLERIPRNLKSSPLHIWGYYHGLFSIPITAWPSLYLLPSSMVSHLPWHSECQMLPFWTASILPHTLHRYKCCTRMQGGGRSGPLSLPAAHICSSNVGIFSQIITAHSWCPLIHFKCDNPSQHAEHF